jgi:hypothetical protein
MDMTAGTMTSASMAAGHEQHDSANGTSVRSGDESLNPSPDASKCVLAASCTTTLAVLSTAQPNFAVRPEATVLSLLATSPHLRAVPPDLPPPRA